MTRFNKFLSSVLTIACFALVSCSGGSTQQDTTAKNEIKAPQKETTTQEQSYIVGTNPVFAPFEYTTKTGEVVGFDIDVMNAIAKDQGFKVTYKNVPWDGIFATLDSGDADILASAISITDERKQRMDFSDPYFEVTQVVILPKDKTIKSVNELSKLGKIGVVTAQTGDLQMQKILGATSPKIARYDDLPLVFKEIQIGGVDALVSDSVAVLYYLKENDSKDKVAIGKDLENEFHIVKLHEFPIEHYGFAVSKNKPELLAKINKGLADIKANGEYDKIKAKYFSTGVKSSDSENAAPADAKTADAKAGETKASASETKDEKKEDKKEVAK